MWSQKIFISTLMPKPQKIVKLPFHYPDFSFNSQLSVPKIVRESNSQLPRPQIHWTLNSDSTSLIIYPKKLVTKKFNKIRSKSILYHSFEIIIIQALFSSSLHYPLWGLEVRSQKLCFKMPDSLEMSHFHVKNLWKCKIL